MKVTLTFTEEVWVELQRLAQQRKQTPSEVIGEGISLLKWFHEHEECSLISAGSRLYIVSSQEGR